MSARLAGSICVICNRPLTDPSSIAMRIGPVCRMKIKNKKRSKEQNLFAMRSVYNIITSQPGAIVIIDQNGPKSVTNDIENILVDIKASISHNLSAYRIMYKDSMGIYDGVECSQDGTFRRFFSLGERDLESAYNKLMDYDFNKKIEEK